MAAPTTMRSLGRVVEYAERFRGTGRWLDLGYGKGALLSVAEERGWSCYGVEVSPQVLEYGKRRKWAVTSEPRGDSRFVAGGFDVVTMVEVLEHVVAPASFLNDMAYWLRRGGGLYLTTPNARCLNRRILGLDWSVVSPPEHVVLWSVQALRRVVQKAGFRVCRVRTEGLNPSEMLASARRWRKQTPVDRNKAAVALSEKLSRTRARRAVKTAINGVLNVLRLGDTLKVWAQRVG